MRLLRPIAGWICIIGALLLLAVVLLGGFGDAGSVAAGSPALMAHLPGVVFALAGLAVGAWLLARRRAP